MQKWAMKAAGCGLLIVTLSMPAALAAQPTVRTQAGIVLAQNEPKKSESVTQKVKRNVKKAWRNLTGYKFEVGCPAVLEVNHYTCSETGKNREDARAKCQSRYALCRVSDAR